MPSDTNIKPFVELLAKSYAVSEQEIRRLAQERAVKKPDDAIAELAAPLARLYAKASPFERAALLVRIVAAVQKGAR